jgi:chromate transport protein ChrA
MQLSRRSAASRNSDSLGEDRPLKQRFTKRPLKLVLVTVLFAFLGVLRLRSITWFTLDTWQMYLGYLTAYIGSSVLSGIVNFVEIGYVTPQPLLGQWLNSPAAALLSYDSFRSVWLLVSGLEIVIAVISLAAVYSTLALRRNYLAKIGSFTLIAAGILDVASPYPIIESILGVLAFYVLLRPDVKEAFAAKGGSSQEKLLGRAKEVTFRADLGVAPEKRKTGIRCPNCGLLLPPSVKVCRRCKTRIT